MLTDINYPNPNEMKIKRRKGDVDSSLPHISVENVDNKNLKNLFVMAVNCWDFLTATEHLQRGLQYVLIVRSKKKNIYIVSFSRVWKVKSSS